MAPARAQRPNVAPVDLTNEDHNIFTLFDANSGAKIKEEPKDPVADVDRRWRCNECQEYQGSWTQLEAHVAADHLNWLPYECTFCSFTRFPTESILRMHHNINHSDDKNIYKMVFTADDDKRNALTIIMNSAEEVTSRPTNNAQICSLVNSDHHTNQPVIVRGANIATKAADHDPHTFSPSPQPKRTPRPQRPAQDCDQAMNASITANRSSHGKGRCQLCGIFTTKTYKHVAAKHMPKTAELDPGLIKTDAYKDMFHLCYPNDFLPGEKKRDPRQLEQKTDYWIKTETVGSPTNTVESRKRTADALNDTLTRFNVKQARILSPEKSSNISHAGRTPSSARNVRAASAASVQHEALMVRSPIAADYSPSPFPRVVLSRQPNARQAAAPPTLQTETTFDELKVSTPLSTGTDKRLSCSLCSVKVSSLSMDGHVFKKHLNECPVACSYCDYKVAYNVALVRKHIVSCHQGKQIKIIDKRKKFEKVVAQLREICFPSERAPPLNSNATASPCAPLHPTENSSTIASRTPFFESSISRSQMSTPKPLIGVLTPVAPCPQPTPRLNDFLVALPKASRDESDLQPVYPKPAATSKVSTSCSARQQSAPIILLEPENAGTQVLINGQAQRSQPKPSASIHSRTPNPPFAHGGTGCSRPPHLSSPTVPTPSTFGHLLPVVASSAKQGNQVTGGKNSVDQSSSVDKQSIDLTVRKNSPQQTTVNNLNGLPENTSHEIVPLELHTVFDVPEDILASTTSEEDNSIRTDPVPLYSVETDQVSAPAQKRSTTKQPEKVPRRQETVADLGPSNGRPKCQLCNEKIAWRGAESHVSSQHSPRNMDGSLLSCLFCDSFTAISFDELTKHCAMKHRNRRLALLKSRERALKNLMDACFPNSKPSSSSPEKEQTSKAKQHQLDKPMPAPAPAVKPILRFGTDPLMCTVCKDMCQPDQLCDHALRHHMPRHKCSFCDFSCSSVDQMRCHSTRTHADQPVPNPKEVVDLDKLVDMCFFGGPVVPVKPMSQPIAQPIVQKSRECIKCKVHVLDDAMETHALSVHVVGFIRFKFRCPLCAGASDDEQKVIRHIKSDHSGSRQLPIDNRERQKDRLVIELAECFPGSCPSPKAPIVTLSTADDVVEYVKEIRRQTATSKAQEQELVTKNVVQVQQDSSGRHKCAVCKGSVTRYVNHIWRHVGQKPFACAYCKAAGNKSFQLIDQSKMKRHVLQEHPDLSIKKAIIDDWPNLRHSFLHHAHKCFPNLIASDWTPNKEVAKLTAPAIPTVVDLVELEEQTQENSLPSVGMPLAIDIRANSSLQFPPPPEEEFPTLEMLQVNVAQRNSPQPQPAQDSSAVEPSQQIENEPALLPEIATGSASTVDETRAEPPPTLFVASAVQQLEVDVEATEIEVVERIKSKIGYRTVVQGIRNVWGLLDKDPEVDEKSACSLCEKKVSQRISLFHVYRKHMTQKPFKCGYCRHRFSVSDRSNVVENHMWKEHKTEHFVVIDMRSKIRQKFKQVFAKCFAAISSKLEAIEEAQKLLINRDEDNEDYSEHHNELEIEQSYSMMCDRDSTIAMQEWNAAVSSTVPPRLSPLVYSQDADIDLDLATLVERINADPSLQGLCDLLLFDEFTQQTDQSYVEHSPEDQHYLTTRVLID